MQAGVDKILLLVEAALEAGIQRQALRDAIPRGIEAFREITVDTTDARHWVASVRHSHLHYFGQAGGAEPASALTPTQIKALEGLSPTQKLTRYRELQQRQASARTSATE
jgi:hypothetical protein